MKCAVVRRVARNEFDIYFYTDGPDGRWAQSLGGRTARQWEQVQQGCEMPVALHLSPEELEALVEAASVELPVDVGMRAVLADTREVRDRLLGLVEHTVTRDWR